MLELIAWIAAGLSIFLFGLAVVTTFIEIPGKSFETKTLTPFEWMGVLVVCGVLGLMSLT